MIQINNNCKVFTETIEQIGNNMGCVGENGLDYQRIYTMIFKIHWKIQIKHYL